MVDFKYYAPTKIIFGKTADENVGAELKGLGASRVLVIYGQQSAVKSGLVGKVTRSLKENGIFFIELGGAKPNPEIDLVRRGVTVCGEQNIDFFLAIGGGSAIDTAKAIMLAYANGVEPWDIFERKVTPTKRMQLGVVLTIAAAGSEMSDSVVITNPDIPKKRGYNTDLVRPTVAFMNPENTFSVGRYQTACGIVDTMMHTMERYFSVERDAALTGRIAEAILISVKEAAKDVMTNPENYDARANLMWASSLSHNGLTGCGRDFKTMTVHQLAHGVNTLHPELAHGAVLSVLYPAWEKFIYEQDVRRFCRMARRVWDIPDSHGTSHTLMAQAGIQATKGFFKSLGMPTTMSELGIKVEEYDQLADIITNNDTAPIWSYVPLGKAEIKAIFRLAE